MWRPGTVSGVGYGCCCGRGISVGNTGARGRTVGVATDMMMMTVWCDARPGRALLLEFPPTARGDATLSSAQIAPRYSLLHSHHPNGFQEE